MPRKSRQLELNQTLGSDSNHRLLLPSEFIHQIVGNPAGESKITDLLRPSTTPSDKSFNAAEMGTARFVLFDNLAKDDRIRGIAARLRRFTTSAMRREIRSRSRSIHSRSRTRPRD